MFRTISIALAVLALIAGGSLLLQAGTLGQPGPGRLALVRTLHVLTRYQRSNAVIHVGTRRYLTSCHDYWGTRYRIANVIVDNRLRLLEVNRQLARRTRSVFDATAHELAGCPRPLRDTLSRDLVSGEPISFRRIRVDGLLTWELQLRSVRPAIELFVSPRTGLPITLALAGRQIHGTSDLTFGARR